MRAQSAALGSLSEASFTYDSPLITLGAALFFLAVMLYPAFPVKEQVKHFLTRWNSYTLGIYLAHPLVLVLLTGSALQIAGFSVQLSWNMFHPALAIPILTAIIYFVSLAGIVLLNYLGYLVRKILRKKADPV